MKVLEGGGQLGPSSVSPCQSFNDTYCSLGGCPLPGLGWGQAAWCPWACRGCWGAVHRCSIGEKSGGSRWPDIYPVSMTRFPAGERPDFRPARDSSPATTPGTSAKLPGVPGHVSRCVAVMDDPIPGRRETRFPPGERPVSGHRPRDPGKVAGRAGARAPMCCRYRRPVFRPGETRFWPAKTRFQPPSRGGLPGCRARWGCVSEARAGVLLPSSCRGEAGPSRPASWLASRPVREVASWRPG